jgi:hypothetical protein
VAAGLEYAWYHGTRSGKAAPGVVFKRDEVAALRAQGFSLRQIARRMGLGVGTVRRVLQAAIAQPGRQNLTAGSLNGDEKGFTSQESARNSNPALGQ